MPGSLDHIPDFRVRVSAKARRVRLVVTPAEGLVVVLPRGVPASEAAVAVRAHGPWIARAMERTSERRAHLASLADAPVPDVIRMPGIATDWVVEMHASEARGVRGSLHGATLVLTGRVEDKAACLAAIRRAVARVARERLPLMLGSAEAETGWSASRVGVRRQRGRWGSCTSKGALSLNEALVFLPPHLVRYVMIHELAHTRRMDHSPAFWAQVESHESAWRDRRTELRQAWRHVPAWADPS